MRACARQSFFRKWERCRALAVLRRYSRISGQKSIFQVYAIEKIKASTGRKRQPRKRRPVKFSLCKARSAFFRQTSPLRRPPLLRREAQLSCVVAIDRPARPSALPKRGGRCGISVRPDADGAMTLRASPVHARKTGASTYVSGPPRPPVSAAGPGASRSRRDRSQADPPPSPFDGREDGSHVCAYRSRGRRLRPSRPGFGRWTRDRSLRGPDGGGSLSRPPIPRTSSALRRPLGPTLDEELCDFIEVTTGVARLQRLVARFRAEEETVSLDHRRRLLLMGAPGERDTRP